MNLKLSSVKVFLPGRTAPLFAIPELVVPRGTRLLIHGPSGRGKTTLLHLMAGLMPPSEGYVFLDDKNLAFLSERERAALRRKAFGVVFQRLNLLDHLTAEENVLLAGHHGEKPRDSARAALERLGIRHLADTRTAQLSLGEQQRIAVARVVYASPTIVLADEPTSSLDAANAEAVADALTSLPGNPTVVVVSHDERLRARFPRVEAFDALVAGGRT